MSVTTFVDTSILVKPFDISTPAKRAAAKLLLDEERLSGGPSISPVVLGEVFHALTRHRRTDALDLAPIANREAAATAVRFLQNLNVVPVTGDMMIVALPQLTASKLGSWDALHLATAAAVGCDKFLTWDSDFPDGKVIAGVRIEHPTF